MPAAAYSLRYQLPKKAIKADCPQCGPKHRRTWSRYVDTRTGELLPDIYGRCDREGNCGYHLSPYTKGSSGISYADEMYEQWKADNSRSGGPVAPRAARRQQGNRTEVSDHGAPAELRQTVTSSPSAQAPIYAIPDEVFVQSIGHYERNQFAHLLRQHFGLSVADELLSRFQIGTSSRWPGATVFWYVDEYGRKRGGQIKLFSHDWHTVKYVDREGRKRAKVDWVHSALIRRCKASQTAVPDWLAQYDQHAERSPCLFGLPQLATASAHQPVALVEAPKTAVLCAGYFPQFVWLATGGLSYLTTGTDAGWQRMAPLRTRRITLFPDLSKDGKAFDRWRKVADKLNAEGFRVNVSDFLEQSKPTQKQREDGLDLADLLLSQWKGYPPSWG